MITSETEGAPPAGLEIAIPEVEAQEIAEWADAAQEILDSEERAAANEIVMPPHDP